MKVKIIILGLIVLIGLLVRGIKIDTRPAGFTWDEAALGYNAYSLLLTGKDEHGQTLPIVFKSFGDYKPGLYIYMTVPFIKAGGMTEAMVRTPSAVSGVLLIIGVFCLTTLLFSSTVGLYAAAIMAVNPWAVHFSRGGWEANLALMYTVWGSVLFLRKKLWIAALFFALSLLAYQGAKMFTPIVVISLLLVFRSRFSIKQLVGPAILGALLIGPVLAGFSTQSGRLKVFSIFSYRRQASEIIRIQSQEAPSISTTQFLAFHGEPIDQLRGIATRYFNHLSPRFLFVDGDWSNMRHSIPFQGYFYWPEVISLLVGFLLLSKYRSRSAVFLAIWIIAAPLPSALSRDIVSGVRSLPLVIPLVIVSGLGISQFFYKKIYLLPWLGAMMFFMGICWDLYFIHSPHYSAIQWLYPYRQAMLTIKEQLPTYEKVIFTNKLGQPYIFWLFYGQVDPREYQGKAAMKDAGSDVGEVTQYGKFQFREFYWPAERGGVSTLVVGDTYELPRQDINQAHMSIVSDIYNPDGSLGLRIVALK